jgi:hypothetical protein
MQDWNHFMKIINNKRWKIQSIQQFGNKLNYIIQCIEFPSDIRRISINGWNTYPDANS